MIYLNNAATSYPKPPSVVKAMTEALEHEPVSALRSTALADGDVAGELRQKLGQLFHIADVGRIFFASSATDAINRVIGGLQLTSVEMTSDNHNSVLRVVENGNIPHTHLVKGDRKGIHTQSHSLYILPHCSNVTGEIHDLKQISESVHKCGMLLMADASQSVGCIPIDVDGWGVDILVFTGHKALFGPTGIGGYYVRRGIDLRPTQFGGTGHDSSVIKYQDSDWEYEVGTPNTVGMAGLLAGINYVSERGVETIFENLQQKTLRLIESLQSIQKIAVYCPGDERQGPVVSFNIEGLSPSDVGYILQNTYHITVRTGLHCAPLIHQELGTSPSGTVRVSLSDFTTDDEVKALVCAVKEIASSL